MSKNASALLISALIFLFILGLIFGANDKYTWASWLFTILFLLAIALLAIIDLSFVRDDSFGGGLIASMVATGLYLIVFIRNINFLNGMYSTNSWFTIILIVSYLLYAALAFLGIFTVVRFIQNKR